MACNFPLYMLDLEGYPYLRDTLSGASLNVRDLSKKQLILYEDEFRYLQKVYHVSEKFFIPIPCGHCMGCFMDYQRMWSNRCMMEASLYEKNCFVTLTYSDEKLPFEPVVLPEGYLHDMPVLRKRDFQLFMKKLRKYCSSHDLPSPRYYAAGEYGDHTKRPHFHSILFNYFPEDAVCINHKTGYYYSEILERIWGNGFVTIGEVSLKSCAYVASYVSKRQCRLTDQAQAELFDEYFDLNPTSARAHDILVKLGRLPAPFALRSTDPGIGWEFFVKNKDYYLKYGKFPPTNGIEFDVTGVRYFDIKYAGDDQVRKIANAMRHSRRAMLAQARGEGTPGERAEEISRAKVSRRKREL